MLPAGAPSGPLTSLTRNGVAVPVSALRVKGIDYKVFSAAAGSYVATYGDGIVPTVTGSGPKSNTPASARRVRLPIKRLRVSSKGTVRIRVKCPSAAGRCRVKLTLRSSGKVLAKRTFKLAGGPDTLNPAPVAPVGAPEAGRGRRAARDRHGGLA